MSGAKATKKPAVLLVIGLIASACSGSVSFSIGELDLETPSNELISGELSDQLGLGEQTPACDIPDDPDPGTEFTCTGLLEDGRVIEYVGVLSEEESVLLDTTNVILDPSRFEADFHEQLINQNPEAELREEDVDCGPDPIVIEDDTFICTVTAGADLLTATVTMADAQNGSFEWEFEESFVADNSGTDANGAADPDTGPATNAETDSVSTPASIQADAERLIATALSEDLGNGEQVPTCEVPANTEVGTEFACTGTLADSRVIDYIGQIVEDDLRIRSTNVMRTELFEPSFFDAFIEANPDGPLDEDGIDCGDEFIVVHNDIFRCTITPNEGSPFTAIVTMSDIESGKFEWDFE